MSKKKHIANKLKRTSFDKKAYAKVNEELLSGNMYHVNTRWRNRFKELDRDTQHKIIERIVLLQFDWVADSINKKITPIPLEGLGKFIIKDGKRDFIELTTSDDFDGDYESVQKEVRKRIDERVRSKRENAAKLRAGILPKPLTITLNPNGKTT